MEGQDTDSAAGVVGVSEDKELLGCGCYDNAVARIIPRITSKVTTQMRMNITFCKKRDRNLQCRENSLLKLGSLKQLSITGKHALGERGGNPAVWYQFMNE